MTVSAKAIELGSGTVAAEIVTVPGVLVNGTAEVSTPVLKLYRSKYVWVLLLIEPLPLAGMRLTV